MGVRRGSEARGRGRVRITVRAGADDPYPSPVGRMVEPRPPPRAGRKVVRPLRDMSIRQTPQRTREGCGAQFKDAIISGDNQARRRVGTREGAVVVVVGACERDPYVPQPAPRRRAPYTAAPIQCRRHLEGPRRCHRHRLSSPTVRRVRRMTLVLVTVFTILDHDTQCYGTRHAHQIDLNRLDCHGTQPPPFMRRILAEFASRARVQLRPRHSHHHGATIV